MWQTYATIKGIISSGSCGYNAAGCFDQSAAAEHCVCVPAFISEVPGGEFSSSSSGRRIALSQRDNASSSVQSRQRVTLERNGCRVECNIQQVTVENLRKMFQVCRDNDL